VAELAREGFSIFVISFAYIAFRIRIFDPALHRFPPHSCFNTFGRMQATAADMNSSVGPGAQLSPCPGGFRRLMDRNSRERGGCRKAWLHAAFLAAAMWVTGCKENHPLAGTVNSPSNTAQQTQSGSSTTSPIFMNTGLSIFGFEVIHAWPHDTKAFTQGLLFQDGVLLESTGLKGESSLRRVELQTGKVLQEAKVPAQYFAEGLALLGDKLYQLTWLDHKVFVYDLKTFALQMEFNYEGEGWGLTTDGHWLFLSDGTPRIRYLDPVTFEVKRTISVSVNGRPIVGLNEMEFVKGEILANVWGAEFVVRIDPATGRVTGAIDFGGLLPASERGPDVDVMNGIAYDPGGDRLFVTGKRWPKLFEVRLRPKR
jgi:glutaminyl-peptide cyclotransferase